MDPTLTLPPEQLAKLTESFHVIAEATGVAAEDVLMNEAGVIVKTWLARTQFATLAQADLRSRVKVMRDLGFTGGANNPDANVSISAGLRGPFGRVWLRKKNGQGWRRTHNANFTAINQHYKNAQWIDLQEAIDLASRWIQKTLPQVRAAIGLPAQSILQIADDLGLNLATVRGGTAPSARKLELARNARAPNGRIFKDGLGIKTKSPGKFMLELINSNPLIGKLGMDRTLAGVLSGRVKYFETNVEKGVFQAQSRVARAYPWLQVAA